MDLKTIANRSTKLVRQYSPVALSILGAAGLIVTVVAAVKATPKAEKLIKEDSMKKHGDPDAYTKKEAVESCWKCYIPTAIFATASIACIFGSNILSSKKQASLIGAYTLLDKTFKDYKVKVNDLYGEGASEAVEDEVIKDKWKKYPKNIDDFSDSEVFIFYEENYGEFFDRTREEVLMAEYHLNRDFQRKGYVTLNEFYEFLGLKKTKLGEAIGWSLDSGFSVYGYSWIDFTHRLITMDDGMECYCISYPFEPTADYLDAY